MDDYIATLVDLDLESLKVVLSIKSDQEEIGDFSFSFNQTDLCLAVIQWIKYDLPKRHSNLIELCEYFCLHQINPNATNLLNNLMELFCPITYTLNSIHNKSSSAISLGQALS